MKFVAVVAIFILVGLLLPSCLQMQKNSSFSNDAMTYAHLGGSSYFLAAQSVMRQNCATCHANFLSMSEEDFLNQPSALGPRLVTAGDPTQSEIYIRLQPGTPRPHMPQNGTLANEDIAIIGRWIESIPPSTHALPTLPAPQTPTPAPPADMSTPQSRFAAVKAIFNRPMSCATCHIGNFAAFTEEAQFLNTSTREGDRLVIPGQALASGLFKRIRGAGSGANATMPPLGMPQLSEDDIRTIRQWIEDM